MSEQEEIRTAPCGFGYDDICCCTCELHFVAKPRCHHIGGKGKCGDGIVGANSPLGRLASEADDGQDGDYVCMLFGDEGVAQTDWTKHGCCEGYIARKLPSAGSSPEEERQGD